jgi:hypothetical protein
MDDISNIISGYIYYRIKQVDIDGKSSTTETKSILIDKDLASELNIYPNPFSEIIHVKFTPAQDEGNIEVIDMEGRNVLSATFQKGDEYLVIDSSGLQPGLYFIKFNGSKYIKVIKAH